MHNGAMKHTAARLVRHALENIGAKFTFGIPGVHNIELYDELKTSETIRPVLVTHEVGAAFMADAVSRVGNTIGVLAIVPAAGITHAMSGIGEAYLDGVPMLVISGGIRTDLQQKFQLHDVDQHALLKPLTKATYRIERYEDAIPTIYQAYRTATEGEPGPVFVELPANLQLLTGEVEEMPAFEGGEGRSSINPDLINRAAQLLTEASKPGIFVGWGARHVAEDIARIAEHIGAPVATTLQGLASFPGDHPLHTGMSFGQAAVPAAENAFKDCDAMLAVGTRFAEISTGSYGAVPPEQLVHIDINPETLNANYAAKVAIAADARDAVPALANAICEIGEPRDHSSVLLQIANDKAVYRKEWLAHDNGDRVNPCRLFDALREKLDDEAILIADDGNHTFLTAELMPVHAGGSFFSPTDFNCMGYCVPASIGAKLSAPEKQVVGIVGDGAFLMTGLESVTAVANELGVIWFVFNDGELAQIAQAQEIPYQRTTCTKIGGLDYEAFAKSTGCAYVAIDNDEAIEAGIASAFERAAENKPVIVNVRIDYSKKTRFTSGVVKTNLERFDTRTKLRMVGRALYRKVFGAGD
jgi:acetolactate synthase-1/2/3 large subunit